MKILSAERQREINLLNQLAPAEFGFQYVKELPAHLQRMAAFWEYAREAPDVIKTANEFREVAGHKSKEAGQRILSKYRGILRAEELILVSHPYFPGISFELLREIGAFPTAFSEFKRFGIAGLLCLPSEKVVRLWKSDELSGFVEPGQEMYSLTIPWNYSDHELAAQFRETIRSLRPKDQQEPRRAGRAGSNSVINPGDMLNQLSAFRLHREGIAFEEAGELVSPHPYLSKKGWNKGIRRARERIARMGKESFFVGTKAI